MNLKSLILASGRPRPQGGEGIWLRRRRSVSLAAPSHLSLRVTCSSESLPADVPELGVPLVAVRHLRPAYPRRRGDAADGVKMMAGRCRRARDIVPGLKSARISCCGFHACFGLRFLRPAHQDVVPRPRTRSAACRGCSGSQVSVAGPNRISFLEYSREARWEAPGVAAGAAPPPLRFGVRVSARAPTTSGGGGEGGASPPGHTRKADFSLLHCPRVAGGSAEPPASRIRKQVLAGERASVALPKSGTESLEPLGRECRRAQVLRSPALACAPTAAQRRPSAPVGRQQG